MTRYFDAETGDPVPGVRLYDPATRRVVRLDTDDRGRVRLVPGTDHVATVTEYRALTAVEIPDEDGP